MLTRYDIAYLAAAPAALPYVAWRWARKRKYRDSGPGMLGKRLPAGGAAAPFAGGSVWLHAVSVGEVAAAKAVEPGLRELFPALPLVLSTTTETGQEAARKSIPGAQAHVYFPLDLSWIVGGFLRAYNPRAVAIMETELWPNFITLAAARGAKVFLLNAKISDRSFPRYRAARGVLGRVFQSIAGVCAQTETDAKRFIELGVDAARVRACGNCKFDLSISPLAPEERAAMRAELGIGAEREVVVAGSTHEGEEALILGAFAEVLKSRPEACLVIAPRHPERFGAVAQLARDRGFRSRRAGEPAGEGEANPQIVILDKMGVLARAYGIAQAAIVAGSFCPVGGHNLLEAAAHAVPVIYGPDMHSQREMAQAFAAAGAGTQVAPDGLAPAMLRFLSDSNERSIAGGKALDVLKKNQGSAGRCVEALRQWRKD